MKNVTTHVTPEKIVDSATAEWYRLNGSEVVDLGEIDPGKRFAVVKGLTYRTPDGKLQKNNVTISHPSSEILTLTQKDGIWYVIFCIQARSPYHVEVDGKMMLKAFIEQPAGCLEEGQSYTDAAIAEVRQELGAKLVYLGRLGKNKLSRHVSYCIEQTYSHWGIAENTLGEQNLDPEENIKILWKPLDEVEKEVDRYLDEEGHKFFGFDVPDVTLLSLLSFFRKIGKGTIDLKNPNPKENLL